MGRNKASKRAAATLDDLDGVASSRVKFIRTDARAAVSSRAGPSQRALREATAAATPQCPVIDGEEAAALLRRLSADCVSSADQDAGPCARPGVRVGLSAVTRALRRGTLRAAVIARDSGPPLLAAHLPALARARDVPACVLACASAQLGQPFGLLRAAAVGLDAEHFAADHPLVVLVARAGIARPISQQQ